MDDWPPPISLYEEKTSQQRTRFQHRKFAPGLNAFISVPSAPGLPCSVWVRDSENPDNNVQFCGLDRTQKAAQTAAEYFMRDVMQRRADARSAMLAQIAADHALERLHRCEEILREFFVRLLKVRAHR